MGLDHRDKIGGAKTGERGLNEVGILGYVISGTGAQVRKITSTSARNENLTAEFRGVIENKHPLSATSGVDGTHQARSARSENNGIDRFHVSLSLCRKSDERERLRYSFRQTAMIDPRKKSHYRVPTLLFRFIALVATDCV
jgi:hypothetical protein